MERIKLLAGHTVIIIGDVMTDRYLHGTVTRISPEAPVPVVNFTDASDRLGGAANVALNIQALGSTTLLCSTIGNDTDGTAFLAMLESQNITTEGIVRSNERKTTVKTRILGNHQQMLRIDKEDSHDLSDQESKMLLDSLKNLLERHQVNALILQDYNKGVLTAKVIKEVIGMARSKGIPIAVDPKKRNFLAYKGVDLFKPNLKEMRDSCPFPIEPTVDSLQKAAAYLQEHLGHKLTMITLSEKGIFIADETTGSSSIYPTRPRNIADVSGAGDTVISVAALGLAAGFSPAEIALLSNLAGGQVCEFSGVVPVDKTILAREWGENN